MSNEKKFNVCQYFPDNWKKLVFALQKEKILAATSNEMQNEAKENNIYTVFRGQTICLQPIGDGFVNATVTVDKTMSDDLCGEYDFATNKIATNALILKDGRLSCESVSHETTHKIQKCIADSKEKYTDNSLESEYATIARLSSSTDNQLNAFGMHVEGRMYISGQQNFTRVLNNKSLSLYTLSPMERHACLTAIGIASKLPKLDNNDLARLKLDHLSYSEMHVAKAVMTFKQEYYCEYLSLQQVYQVVDNAQTFVALGHGLTNDLEANVAYDMMALIEYENSLLPKHDALKVLIERMDPEVKTRALNEIGYTLIDKPHEMIGQYIIFNDKPIYGLDSVDQLIEMPRDEQIANPLMIANFAFENEIDVFPYLHCPEAFEEWLYSESSLRQLTREIQEGLGEILGEKYSLENRRIVIAQRKEQQSEQTLTEDVGYVFERGD